MNVVISCGGTGGHITPALAIADMLRENLPRVSITFIGTDGGMENALVAAAGYPIHTLAACGISRRDPIKALSAWQQLHRATDRAEVLLRKLAPAIVIGTGSYACYPALASACRMGLKTAVHESNTVPGLAVRLLAARLSRVWLGFAETAAHLPKRAKVLFVGNPVSHSFYQAPPQGRCAHTEKTVLSFGGSLGATAINNAVLHLMLTMRAYANVSFVHATGKREFEPFMERLSKTELASDRRFTVLPFISDMPRRMHEADLVIARAGAMTISELAAAGCAAVLVPSPNVTGNHQLKNAKALAAAGAAALVEEKELLRGELIKTVSRLLNDDSARGKMQGAILRYGSPHATRLILEDILTLTRKKG